MLIIISCCKILKRGTLWLVLVKNSLHFTPFLLISCIISIGQIGILPEARNQSPKGEIKTPTKKVPPIFILVAKWQTSQEFTLFDRKRIGKEGESMQVRIFVLDSFFQLHTKQHEAIQLPEYLFSIDIDTGMESFDLDKK